MQDSSLAPAIAKRSHSRPVREPGRRGRRALARVLCGEGRVDQLPSAALPSARTTRCQGSFSWVVARTRPTPRGPSGSISEYVRTDPLGIARTRSRMRGSRATRGPRGAEGLGRGRPSYRSPKGLLAAGPAVKMKSGRRGVGRCSRRRRRARPPRRCRRRRGSCCVLGRQAGVAPGGQRDDDRAQ